MGRVVRTTLPVTKNILEPKVVTEVTDKLKNVREQQKRYADRGCTTAPEFVKSQSIVVRNMKSHLWEKGTIQEKLDQPRSYIVNLSDHKLRRNTRDIRESKTTPSSQLGEDPFTVVSTRSGGEGEITTTSNSSIDDRDNEDQPVTPSSPIPRSGREVTPPSPVPTRTRSGREVRTRRDNDFEYY